ncbi:hypothetical protein AAHE18_03G018900 [Arachis hypogaea]|nr:uncharacterized protein DS421_3g61390 [Arachis hypogaea]
MTTKSVIHAQIKFLTIIGVVIYFVIAEFHEISPNKKYWDEHNACNYYCKKENFDDPKELLGCIKVCNMRSYDIIIPKQLGTPSYYIAGKLRECIQNCIEKYWSQTPLELMKCITKCFEKLS